MENNSYVGLDASVRRTSICVVDATGKVLCEGIADSHPAAIAKFLKARAPGAVRIGIGDWADLDLAHQGAEGARSSGDLYRCPACEGGAQDADQQERPQRCCRHRAHHANRLVQRGSPQGVRQPCHPRPADEPGMLVKIKRDLENQIRGLLKIDGLLVGTARGNTFFRRALELAKQCPELGVSVVPLLAAREAVDKQVYELDRKVLRLARADRQTRSFMTVPGVGPVTALCF
jgi:hypothetical protein